MTSLSIILMEGLGNTFCVLDGFNPSILKCFVSSVDLQSLLKFKDFLPSDALIEFLQQNNILLSESIVTSKHQHILDFIEKQPTEFPFFDSIEWTSLLVRFLCHHFHTDGLLVASPPSTPDVAEIRMIYFNRDGSRSAMCGNGLRCVALYSGRDSGTVETDCGLRRFHKDPSSGLICVEMGEPLVMDQCVTLSQALVTSSTCTSFGISGLPVQEESPLLRGSQFFRVNMGNPHLVVLLRPTVDRTTLLQDPEFETVGRALEIDKQFGDEGNNIEFIVQLNPATDENRATYFQRTWERGCGETKACGSGACAAFTALLLSQSITPVQSIAVEMLGGTLYLSLDVDPFGKSIIVMSGDARYY